MTQIPPYADPNLDRKRGLIKNQYGLNTANYSWQRGNIRQQQNLDTAGLTQQFGQMRQALPGQYANRGLLNSGIYSQGLYDFNQNKANQFAKLANQYSTQLHNNTVGQQQAGQDQATGLADVDYQEAQARAALAAQLKAIV